MARQTFKEWSCLCELCECEVKVLEWNYNFPTNCPCCSGEKTCNPVDSGPSQTVMIATDDIPGGLGIRHGLCNEDGSERKYYSKTEIKREANRRGYTIGGDTPKPYKVYWEGKRDS